MTVKRLRDHKISIWGFLFWSAAWISLMVMVYIPDLVGPISRLVKIKPIDLGVYVGMIVAYFILFKLESHLKKISDDIKFISENINKKDKRR
jgi:hypothetical protein